MSPAPTSLCRAGILLELTFEITLANQFPPWYPRAVCQPDRQAFPCRCGGCDIAASDKLVDAWLEDRKVQIQAIGVKKGNRLLIAGEEVEV